MEQELLIKQETETAILPMEETFEDKLHKMIPNQEAYENALKQIHEEFPFDLNDKKYSKCTNVILSCLENGFFVKKCRGYMVVASNMERVPKSAIITDKEDPYVHTLKEYLPKTVSPSAWLNHAFDAYKSSDIHAKTLSTQKFFDEYFFCKNLYNFAKAGLSFAKQDHQIFLLNRKNRKDNTEETVIYLQLDGIKMLMANGGCENINYDIVYNDEEFNQTRSNQGDLFQHKINLTGKRTQPLTVENLSQNICGAFAYCKLHGYSYVEYMSACEIYNCFNCSDTCRKINEYYEQRRLIEKEVEKMGITHCQEKETKVKALLKEKNIYEPNTPWAKFTAEMVKKTVIHHLYKRVKMMLNAPVREAADMIIEDDFRTEYSLMDNHN